VYFWGIVLLFACASASWAQDGARTVTIPAQELRAALDAFIQQSGVQLIYNVDDVAGVRSRELVAVPTESALKEMLRDTGIYVHRDRSGAMVISRTDEPRRRDEAAAPLPERVIVTGTRIRGSDDFPTPVTILPAGELNRAAPSNFPDALNKLPVFAAAQTSNSTTSGANGRGFRPTGNFLDLRGLGPNRTLILEDGRRVPATFFDGTVDTNILPQMLVQRVEVVTGGASAVYGSGAVAGVVNFVLDKEFEGFKGLVQGGISGYGDTKSFRIGLAGGQTLFERAHAIWSVEYYDRAGIPDQAARPYGDLATSVVGSGSVASPYRLVYGVRRSDASYGGLATSGPFQGLQFVEGGALAPFNPGTPTPTGGIAIGGDGGLQHNEYLLPAINTIQAFGRIDYEFHQGLNGYLQVGYGATRSYEANQTIANTASAYPITIYSGNAFLLPSQQDALTATNTGFFTLNRVDDEFSRRLALNYRTEALALTVGLGGGGFGDFRWDAYYIYGPARTKLATPGNVNSERFYAAIDAVRDPANGNIVCRVALTAPGAYPGCVPLNLFGPTSPSLAAMEYVQGTTSWTAQNDLHDFGLNLNGTLLQGWAGPIQLALGGEVRRQGLDLSTSVPDLAFNPQHLRVGGPLGATVPPSNLKWFKETLSAAKAAASVYEADIELKVPLAQNLRLIQQFTVDAAYRYTYYSTSGATDSWKLGAYWQMFEDFGLRAALSRDIRAPTLFDLFQQPLTTNSGISDTLTSMSGIVNTVQSGNPALKPEVAENSMAGFVFAPGWLPGFRFSADYFHIGFDNAIGIVAGSSPIVQNICLESGGASPLCSLTVRPFPLTNTSPANFPTLFYAVKQNIARTYSEGFDVEAEFRTGLDDLVGVDGTLSLRVLWTHQPIFKTQTLPGTLITDAAGTAQTPVDRFTVLGSYSNGPLAIDMVARYQSAFHQSPNPTLVYDIPDVRAYYQFDLNLSYAFSADERPLTGFLNVSNLFNAQGGIYQVPAYTGSPGMNYPVGPGSDLVGRYFTIGVRINTP
jgi:outer membrane receptor protein involved in Fe transport